MAVPTGQTPESIEEPTRIYRREDLLSYPSYSPSRPVSSYPAPPRQGGPEYGQHGPRTVSGQQVPSSNSPLIPALVGLAGVGLLGAGLWFGFFHDSGPSASPTEDPTSVTTEEPGEEPTARKIPEAPSSPEPTDQAMPEPSEEPSPTWSGIGRRPDLPDYPLELNGYVLEEAGNEFSQEWRSLGEGDSFVFVDHRLYGLEWMTEGFDDLTEVSGYLCGHGSLGEFSCFIETSDGTTEIYGFYASEQTIIDFTAVFAAAWLG